MDLVLRRELSQRIWLSSPHLGEEETAFVEEAFRTNWIAPLGPHVDGFERELAAYDGVGHAAALSSGTAAHPPGAAAARRAAGRHGVLLHAHLRRRSCNPDPVLRRRGRSSSTPSRAPGTCRRAALERAFEWAQRESRLPRCVIVVDLYGQSADMDALLPICERYGVPVLEDAAEALGATYKGRASGSFGRVGVFSFNGNKIITTSGGGMLVSDDERAGRARAQARRRRRASRRRTTSTRRSASTTA